MLNFKIMSVTLELKAEVEARVVAQARARGVSIEDFLASVIENELNGKTKVELTPQEKSELWRAFVDSHKHITAPPADDSRESIYREREDSQL